MSRFGKRLERVRSRLRQAAGLVMAPRASTGLHARRHRPASGSSRGAIEALESRTLLASEPIITEFMAWNMTGLQRETPPGSGNWEHPDWIEIYNPSAGAINLEGYYLTDNPGNLTKWQFPAYVLNGNSYTLVIADGTDKRTPEFRTNFELNKESGYLALVKPDGVTIVSEYAPGYPSQLPDVSYGVTLTTVQESLISSVATVKVKVPTDDSMGTDWNGSNPAFDDFAWTIGVTGVGFDDGLVSEVEPNNSTSQANDAGTSYFAFSGSLYHLGFKGNFGTNADWFNIGNLQAGDVITITVSGSASSRGTLPNPGVQLYRGNPASPVLVVSDEDSGPGQDALIYRFTITDTDTYYVTPISNGGTGSYDVAIWLEDINTPPGTGGSFTAEIEPNDTAMSANNASGAWRAVNWRQQTAGVITAADSDFYSYQFTAGSLLTIRVAASAGLDARVALLNASGTVIAQDDGTSAYAGMPSGDSDIYAMLIPSTGTYYVRIQPASGTTGNYTLTTYLSSTTAPPPSTWSQLAATNVRDAMLGQNASVYMRLPFTVPNPGAYDSLRLRMKYDDGFVAYLNGQEIARRNAPQFPTWNSSATGTRADAQAMVYEDFDIALTPGLLSVGANILAIHGMNISASDGDLLFYPELIGMKTYGEPRYFQTPTPGSPNNTGGASERVKDTTFNHDRGFYYAPFTLEIRTETPDAQIRYTLDGTAPTATTGFIYTGPLIITQTTTVRAAAFKPGYLPTNVDTQTYLFLDDILIQAHDNTQLPGGWPAPGSTPNGQQVDYGMDPDVVGNPAFGRSALVVTGTAPNYIYSWYYAGRDNSGGWELFKSDGSTSGTNMLKDLWSGSTSSFPSLFTAVGANVFFKGTDGSTGYELWKTNGTTAGTVLVKDLYPGASSGNPRYLTAVGSKLFFVATDGTNGYELWVSDGTSAGTVMLKDIAAGSASSNPQWLTAVGNTLFFVANDGVNGYELWKSDGTTGGTVMVKDIYAGAESSNPSFLMNFNGTLYFAAADGSSGNELWKSDGTSAGTMMVRDINPGAGGSSPSFLTAAGEVFYFGAWEPATGNELWRSDGTTNGTVMVADIDPGASNSTPCFFTPIGGAVFFQAETVSYGRELWRTDALGTMMVADINPGTASSNPSQLTNVAGTLFLVADNGTSGRELYKSDGASATLVKDINSGAAGSDPVNLTSAGGALFFHANNGVNGYEMWKSDGTTSGTVMVKDAYTGGNLVVVPGDFTDIPTFSVVMDMNDMWSASTGWYTHGTADPRDAYEKVGSLELIYPDGTRGFQIQAGMTIRGGYSNGGNNPKHGIHFYFRNRPGYDGRLEYPLYGPDGPQVLERFDLRCAQNYSWSFGGDSRHIAIRDQYSRDLQMDMGQPGAAGDFYHLYVNGVYWGLYNTDDRPNAYEGAEMYGGRQEDYDVIKVDPDKGYVNEAVDGNMTAFTDFWNQLYAAASGGNIDLATYMRFQGKNPDGSVNPSYPNYLDVDNLIDYMLTIYWGGNLDAPLSNFLGNTSPNNAFAMRSRLGTSGGWKYYQHDAEHTLLDLNQDRFGPPGTFYFSVSSASKANAQSIFELLTRSAEFRLRVADRVHEHMFNDGTLTPARLTELFLRRRNEVYRAMNAESARWGDSRRATPLLRDVEWIAEINRILTSYLPFRTGVVFNQLKSRNLYPSNIQAPEFNQHGGVVSANFMLTITNPNGSGTVYYTLNGKDPRLPGGGIEPTALTYAGPFNMGRTARVIARIRFADGSWSPSVQADFVGDLSKLRPSELMYNPAPPAGGPYTATDYEFIELTNTGPTTLNLEGSYFDKGITYTFGPGALISPGGRLVVAKNVTAFQSRYGTSIPVVGGYVGDFSDSGETVRLVDPAGAEVFSFEYKGSWYPITNGGGYSLVVINTAAELNLFSTKDNWRPSNLPGGGPGAPDPGLNPGTVVINELLTWSTDPVAGNWIEIRNTSSQTIDISGWFLAGFADANYTPSDAELRMYQFPAGTRIESNRYLLLRENVEFGNPSAPGVITPFTLSRAGGKVILANNDGMGNPAGYRDEAVFMGAEPDVSFGLYYVESTGRSYLTAMTSATPGAANAQPVVGPVVISEIMYNPTSSAAEFIELRNLTDQDLPLYDPANPQNTWKFVAGVTFTFPASPPPVIPANGFAVVVGMDPAVFRSTYNVPPGVPVFGPYTGNLDNGGERLEIARPGQPVGETVPYVSVDRVDYDDDDPWPGKPDGKGPSLLRTPAQAYGNDPNNWRSGYNNGTPGRQEAPIVDLGPDGVIQSPTFDRWASFSDPMTDVNQTWTVVVNWGDNTAPETVPYQPDQTFLLHHTFMTPGSYTITATVTDSFGEWGMDSVVITIPPGNLAGTPDDDVYTIRLDATGQWVQFFCNVPTSGPPSFQLARSSLTSIGVSLLDGDDTLKIDLLYGNPIPSGGLIYSGGGGYDTLYVYGHQTTAVAENVVVYGTYATYGSTLLSFSGLEQFWFDGGAGTDNLTVSGVLPLDLQFVGGSGADKLTVTGTPTSDALALYAGRASWAGKNILLAAIEYLQFDAGMGDDTYTQAEPPAGVWPTFNAGNDLGDIVVLLGSAGNDSITLSGSNPLTATWNSVQIKSTGVKALRFEGQAGNDSITTSGMGYIAAVLIGGEGNDTLTISGTTSANTLTAGPLVMYGSDTFDLRDWELLVFDAKDGNDTLTVNGVVPCNVNYLAGAGTADKLSLSGTSGDDYMGLISAALAFYGTTQISLSNAEQIDIRGNGGNDIISLAAPFTYLSMITACSGDEGIDRLQLVGTAGDDAVSFYAGQVVFGATAFPTAGWEAVELIGGDGNDTLTIAESISYSPRFKGGAGVNTLLIPGASCQLDADAVDETVDVIAGGSSTITFAGWQRMKSLTLNDNASASMIADGGLFLNTTAISIASGARLDVNDNGLIVNAQPGSEIQTLNQIEALVAAGRNGGSWNGNGLRSAAAAADYWQITTLGVLLNDDGTGQSLLNTFFGESVGASSILVAYAYVGDVDYSGVVAAEDYFRADQGYLNGRARYRDGDFDFNGVVDADDYYLIDRAFLNQSGPVKGWSPPAGAMAIQSSPAQYAPGTAPAPEVFSAVPIETLVALEPAGVPASAAPEDEEFADELGAGLLAAETDLVL